MDRIARIIVGHSRLILAATALVSLFAVAMLFRMDFNADVASFVLEGNPTGEAFQELQDKYSAADPINVVASLGPEATFREPGGLGALIQLRDELAGIEGVIAVASIVPDVNPLTGEPITTEALGDVPEPMIAVLLEQSPVAPLLLSEDGRHTLLLLTPGGDTVAVARAVDDVVAPPGISLTFSGNPVVFASVIDLLTRILLLIPPAVIVLLILVFASTIGDRKLSALAIVPAGLGSLWTFGLIFGLGREVDIVTVIVPIFVIVMGSADGLHFVTHFQEETDEPDPVARVRSALSHVGVPMILTTVSTAAGFLSLVATDGAADPTARAVCGHRHRLCGCHHLLRPSGDHEPRRGRALATTRPSSARPSPGRCSGWSEPAVRRSFSRSGSWRLPPCSSRGSRSTPTSCSSSRTTTRSGWPSSRPRSCSEAQRR